MKVLLLEDDNALNRAIAKILRLHEYTVESFFDGLSALQACQISEYDLYILDINVPNINGLELLKRLQETNHGAKAIIISSNTDLFSLQEAYQLGCVDYLKKPFHLDELRIKIEKLKTPRKHLFVDVQLKDDQEPLTKKERDLLNLLMENQNKIVTYAQIEEYVYDGKMMTMDGLRALIRRLRKKLTDDIIRNVIDEGYTISNTQNPVFFNTNLEQNVKQRILELEMENSQLKRDKELLAQKSMNDPLTGLLNKIKIEELFFYEQKQSLRYGDPLSVILMDIDDFKAINEQHGHQIGDRVLETLSQFLKTILRNADILGRWEGSSFLFILPKTDENDTRILADKLKHAISMVNFHPIENLFSSFGLASLVENDTFDSIVKRAEMSLYLAKEKRKSKVELIDV